MLAPILFPRVEALTLCIYSAPHIYAVVLEHAALVAGCRVLCVGSGTGYFCALAAELVSKLLFSYDA